MKKVSFFSLVFLFIISCSEMETVIDLEIPTHETVLVLNGVLDTDSSIKVSVSHSAGAFDNANPSFIRDADVLLFENDIFVDTLITNLDELQTIYINDENYNSIPLPMYYYKSDFIPKSEKTYKIEVNHPDYNSINATTFIEKGLNIYDLSIDSLSNVEKINFTFSFDDNANKQNYYRLKLFASCEKDDDYWGYGGYVGGGEPGRGKFRGVVEMQSNDPSFPQTEFIPENGYTFIGEQVIFSDALFNGQKKTISVDVETYFKLNDCDTISFEFSTFSEDTYSYFSSLGEHRDKGELGIFGGEVIPVYSNVYNGLGVLISVNSQQFFVKPTQ
tara:strand:- start:85 stop:1077 length:993 start_codon:yes stop_codon:yes gene_type:complete